MTLQVTSPDGGGRHQTGTHDKGRNTEEPGEGKLSSPVLEQRWARRLTHRLSQIERERHAIGLYACEYRRSKERPSTCRVAAGRLHDALHGRRPFRRDGAAPCPHPLPHSPPANMATGMCCASWLWWSHLRCARDAPAPR